MLDIKHTDFVYFESRYRENKKTPSKYAFPLSLKRSRWLVLTVIFRNITKGKRTYHTEGEPPLSHLLEPLQLCGCYLLTNVCCFTIAWNASIVWIFDMGHAVIVLTTSSWMLYGVDILSAGFSSLIRRLSNSRKSCYCWCIVHGGPNNGCKQILDRGVSR